MVTIDPETGLFTLNAANQTEPVKREDPHENMWERMAAAEAAAKSDPSFPNPKALNPCPVDLAESLLVQPSSINLETILSPTGCHNIIDRPYKWLRTVSNDVQKKFDPNWFIINHMGPICKAAQIYKCQNPDCAKRVNHINGILPETDWRPFRDWVIQIISCELGVQVADRNSREFLHVSNAIMALNFLFEATKISKATDSVTGKYTALSGDVKVIDLFPVCEILYWAVSQQLHLGNNRIIFLTWGNTMIPYGVIGPALERVTKKAREHGICLNRIWGLSLVSDRGEHDLPAIMDLAEQYKELRHHGHEACTASLCGSMTVDATRVKQLHKCSEGAQGVGPSAACGAKKLFFDPALLGRSMKSGGGTTWSVNEPYEVQSLSTPYVTISHVWSDGTGVGIEAPGYVNPCLFNYFANLVKGLGCTAIWWDSVSIPIKADLRVQAINKMHNNYSLSRFTLVHDSYLTNFEWKDDGSPALALILSPWFSRGWTSVECNMARKIKVIYKNPGTNEPIVKDLDDDILAKDPSQCSRGHWIASNILRRLRQPITNVSDLLAILKPRVTSWPRDRMIIAGLLARIPVDYSMSPSTITKAVFRKLRNVNHASLLHTETAIKESEGWSWCPNYIYDLPASPAGEFAKALLMGVNCIVDDNGAVSGEFPMRRVNRDDLLRRRIIPLSSHPFVITRIKAALEQWQDCLLAGHYPGPYLLLKTELPNDGYYPSLLYTRQNEYLMCKYLGAVQTAGDEEMYTPENYDPLLQTRFIIAREPNNYAGLPHLQRFATAAQMTEQWSGFTIAPRVRWSFSQGHVYFGDIPGSGDLLVLRTRQVPHPVFGAEYMVPALAAYNLETKEKEGDYEIDVKSEPSISFSANQQVESFSGAWSKELPSINYVDVNSYWPPLELSASERTTSDLFVRGLRVGRDAKPSDYLFKLEFLSKTVTYAAIQNCLLDASEKRPWVGIWACILPDGRSEFHLFLQPADDEVKAMKLTSVDILQPRGTKTLEILTKFEVKSEDKEDSGKGVARIKMNDEQKLTMAGQFDEEAWGWINFRVLNKDAIDLYVLPEGVMRIQGTKEHEYKYRRVSPNVLTPLRFERGY
ncbi:hypothetical protein TWF694_009499 [Orbilia ellipsospora]|uniref:Heterokaryon incompatibility domain-containing protein n=1 Tax=Orbilia ellipsospora TaxID=2528407 RepID=A0AAV9XDP2_9PEZI